MLEVAENITTVKAVQSLSSRYVYLCWLLSISVPKKNVNDGSTGSFSLQFMKK